MNMEPFRVNYQSDNTSQKKLNFFRFWYFLKRNFTLSHKHISMYCVVMMENFYYRKIIFQIHFIYHCDFLFLLDNFSARKKIYYFMKNIVN